MAPTHSQVIAMSQNSNQYTPLFPAESTKSKKKTVRRVLLTKGVDEEKFRQIVREQVGPALKDILPRVEEKVAACKQILAPGRGKTSTPSTTKGNRARGQAVRKMIVCNTRRSA